MPLLSARTTAAPEKPAAATPRFGPRHKWIVLAIGVAAQASFAASFQGLPVTATDLRTDYHLSAEQLGLALSVILLGIAVSEVPWGLVTDRWGERKVLLTGLLGTGVCLTSMALFVSPAGQAVPAVGLLVAGLLLVGVLGGSVNGSSGRSIMAWFRDGRRGLAMSIRQTAIPAGGAIGAALLPWLASDFGFQAVYGVLAAMCFATALVTWRWLYQPADTEAQAARQADEVATTTSSPLRSVDVWRLSTASALLTVPQFAVLTFATVFLVDVKHAGVAAASAAIFIVQVGGATGRIVSGQWTDRGLSRRSYIRGIGVLTALVVAVTASLVDAPTIPVVVTLVLGGLLASSWHGVAYTEVAAVAGAQRAGTALGIANTTVFTAAFLVPLIIPVVSANWSWTAVWFLAAASALLATFVSPKAAAVKAAS
jgi:sugar phosphate permease